MRQQKILILTIIFSIIISCVGCKVSMGDPVLDKPINNEEDVIEADSKMDESVLKDDYFESNDLKVEFADGWKHEENSSVSGFCLKNGNSSIGISASLNSAKDKATFDFDKESEKKSSQLKEITLNGHTGYYFDGEYNNTYIYLTYNKHCIIYKTKELALDSKKLLKQIEKVKFKKHSDNKLYSIINDDTLTTSSLTVKLANDWKFDLDNVNEYGRALLINGKKTFEITPHNFLGSEITAKEKADEHALHKSNETDMKETDIDGKKCYYFESIEDPQHHPKSTLFMDISKGCFEINIEYATINDDFIKEQIKNIN